MDCFPKLISMLRVQYSLEPEEVGWSQRRLAGARGGWLEAEEVGRSQRRLAGARGGWPEPEEVGRSQRRLDMPHARALLIT